tara:strand:- start:5328 stop:5543 length:216 start_codon:yes stop_codon:yes gene_type:complete
MPQRTLKFKIHQDGRIEELVEGFDGILCDQATKSLEESLGEVKTKKKTSEAFIANKQNEVTPIVNQTNVTF